MGDKCRFRRRRSLNLYFLHKYMNYRLDIAHTVRCFVSAGAMGAAVVGTYAAAYPALHSNTPATILAILVGVVVYGLAVVLTHTVRAEDVESIPKIGKRAAGVIRKLDIFGKR